MLTPFKAFIYGCMVLVIVVSVGELIKTYFNTVH